MKHLKEENRKLTHQIWSLQSEVSQLKSSLQELTEKCKPYLEALKVAPQKVKAFLDDILDKFKKQEKSIYFEPIMEEKQQLQKDKKVQKIEDTKGRKRNGKDDL